MSNYKYSLQDYHAIESANIRLDGITVICGENGCGKSTLSRWLYYIVNGITEFNLFVYQIFIYSLQEEINLLRAAYQDIRMHRESSSLPLLYEGQKKLDECRDIESEENVQQALFIYKNIIEKFGKLLYDYLKETNSRVSKDRVLRFLGIDVDSPTSIHVKVDDFISHRIRKGEEFLHQYRNEKENRELSRFFSLIKSNYDIREEVPKNKIELSEDKVNLFRNQKVGYLYNLKRAIYVDTPMAISEEVASDNIFWNDLQNCMIVPLRGKIQTKSEKKLILRLQKLIKGNVSAERDDFGQLELRYKREDGLDIKLDDVATGIKSFSYILRLLENGYLDEHTLLLIDEPAAHLHPQWVVEFARILVLLNKELGVKIMIASHNPDMVAAIHSISRREGLVDSTVFYLAISADKPFRYVYGELGNNVEEIFKSFNIAFERIKQYGESTGL